MRWARGLLASGVAPSEIAIATASPADYDDHFLALRADANIDLHFVHGVRTVSTRDGQAAAALADISSSTQSIDDAANKLQKAAATLA